MKSETIDLNNFLSERSKVFTGRDRGVEVRQKSHIDEIDANADEVKIIIPETIYDINPSFLEEFFKNIIHRIGKSAFLNKYTFEQKGDYKIEEDLETAIDRILRKRNALV